MLSIDPMELAPERAYRLMKGIVVPRPIAWVTSIGPGDTVNLAPFSCYTFVSNRPVMAGISIGRKPEGRKDTATNIARTGEFVLNVAHESEADAVHMSSAEYPPHVSEAAALGLQLADSSVVAPESCHFSAHWSAR